MAVTDEISIDSIFSAKDKGENGELLAKPYTFVIKPYQRGYRWEAIHINHLIEDLVNFTEIVNENGRTIKKKYCLQPIIVKAFNETENEWELVDGQQRSISLWLMRRVCFWFREDPDETDDLFYSFRFENKPELQSLVDAITEETRTPQSAFAFINNVRTEEQAGNHDFLYNYFNIQPGKNIDVDCMMECLRAILVYPRINMALKSIFLSPDMQHPPKSKSILLVWYQLESSQDLEQDDDAISVFSNINANKIKLTESELIKAQILYNLRGLEKKDEEAAKIALHWEEIERTLCDDGFWYFLNAGDGKETGTRIDFLFEIWSKQEDGEAGSVDRKGLSEGWDKSDYPLSDLLENTIKNSPNKPKTAKAIWNRICSLLDTLSDWKNDYYFYHMIGLIVSVNRIARSASSSADIIQNCIQNYRQMSSKDEFKEFLKAKVKEQMFSIIEPDKEKNFYNFVVTMESLGYEEQKDKAKIKIVLLMHNIASLINAQNEHERFPFELFFTDHYDIEHVNPQNPDEENITALKEWYDALGIKIDETKDVGELLKNAKQIAAEKKLHSIGNLVLLDENTNRSYQNKSFFEKRSEIISILRTGKRKLAEKTDEERYIPIGTKWVFLKAFSDIDNIDKASVHHIWDGEEEYRKDLINQLWTLQSGLKIVSGELEYYVYDEQQGRLNMQAPGLIVDKNGRYYYLNTNSETGEIERKTGSIEINGILSNGLISDGHYTLSSDGKLVLAEDEAQGNEV